MMVHTDIFRSKRAIISIETKLIKNKCLQMKFRVNQQVHLQRGASLTRCGHSENGQWHVLECTPVDVQVVLKKIAALACLYSMHHTIFFPSLRLLWSCDVYCMHMMNDASTLPQPCRPCRRLPHPSLSLRSAPH